MLIWEFGGTVVVIMVKNANLLLDHRCKPLYEVCLQINGNGVKKMYFNSKYQTTLGPFQIISLECNALFHISLAYFYALLEDASQLRRYSSFDAFLAFKNELQ